MCAIFLEKKMRRLVRLRSFCCAIWRPPTTEFRTKADTQNALESYQRANTWHEDSKGAMIVYLILLGPVLWLMYTWFFACVYHPTEFQVIRYEVASQHKLGVLVSETSSVIYNYTHADGTTDVCREQLTVSSRITDDVKQQQEKMYTKGKRLTGYLLCNGGCRQDHISRAELGIFLTVLLIICLVSLFPISACIEDVHNRDVIWFLERRLKDLERTESSHFAQVY